MIVTIGIILGLSFTTQITDSISEQEKVVFELINEIRVKYKLPEFQLDEQLSIASRAWSKHLRGRGLYHARGVTEILAKAGSSKHAVSLWMRSGPHRSIVLSRATHIGIGVDGNTFTARTRFIKATKKEIK